MGLKAHRYFLAFSSSFWLSSRSAAIWSGGFSRRSSYAHLVFIADDPAFVFARDTPGDLAFGARLAELDGRADLEEVERYRIYTGVEPLDRIRQP